MTDQEIIGLFQSRDQSAIGEVQTKYGAYCFRVADNILKNRQDSEECVNDTWLRAWNAIPPAFPKALRMFLAKITRNLSFNRYQAKRRGKRGGGELETVLEELEECLTDGFCLEEEILARELGECVNRFVRGLPEQSGNVFVRRYFYTETMAEIAERYGLTQNHVGVILSRTRKALRAYLEKSS